MEKRYYWLKLKDDFFDSIRIKKLRSLAGGDTFTIIYLKMLLNAMKNDGIIRYQGLEDNLCDEIALELNESPDNVQVTVHYLLSCGLAEGSYNDCFLPEAIGMVGSETTAAERKRNSRERQKMLLECDNVTQMSQECHTEKREKIKEIEKRDKRKEPEEYFLDTELDGLFAEFLDMRKKMKAVNSDIAVKRLVNKINTLSNGDRDTAMEIIGQSIENSWKGVFPVKTKKVESRISDVDKWVASIEAERGETWSG